MGKWTEALAIADEHNAIQIKAVHHAAATHAEALGDVATAAHRFEAAGTAAAQVPRMLLLSGAEEQLEAYAADRHRGDSALARWWGGFLASRGAVDEAAAVYAAAEDTLSQVRFGSFPLCVAWVAPTHSVRTVCSLVFAQSMGTPCEPPPR